MNCRHVSTPGHNGVAYLLTSLPATAEQVRTTAAKYQTGGWIQPPFTALLSMSGTLNSYICKTCTKLHLWTLHLEALLFMGVTNFEYCLIELWLNYVLLRLECQTFVVKLIYIVGCNKEYEKSCTLCTTQIVILNGKHNHIWKIQDINFIDSRFRLHLLLQWITFINTLLAVSMSRESCD